ncbi:MAG: hypothetical protein WC919_04060 [Candidatus Paceibacterota bacterium]|jgi:hypothetical protein
MSEEQVPVVKKRKQVSNPDFVKAYHECESYVELAEKTGLSRESCAGRSGKLRQMGVILPAYKRQTKRVDVEALNALAPFAGTCTQEFDAPAAKRS